MNTGHFTKDSLTYVIEDMFPIRPLINYIWNEEYIMGVDHTGQGKGFASVGEGLRRDLFLPDCDNRLIYIKDEENGDYACINKPFSKDKLECYRCNVGIGMQQIESRHQGIDVAFTMTVPQKGKAELWEISLKNISGQTKRLSVYVYAKVHVNETPHCSYNISDWSDEVGGLLFQHKIYGEEHPYSSLYLCADEKAASYCTSDTRFKGYYQTLEHPIGLEVPHLDSRGSSYDEYPAAALQFEIELLPKEERKLHLAAGVALSAKEAKRVAEKYLQSGFFADTLKKRKQDFARIEEVFCLESGNAYLDKLTNVWLKNQIQLGKTWARVYGKGIRDMLQDITAFVSMDGILAREKTLKCLEYQYADGNTVRMYAPFLRHPYMDGAAWIPETVLVYLKETGDIGIFTEEVPFFESEESGTVTEHIRRGIRFLTTQTGKHGLCLWGGGDWNDSINNAGMQGIGESVWLSIATVKACRQYAEILKLTGALEEASQVSMKAEQMRRQIIKYGFEEDRFIYGYTDWNEKVGSDDCMEGKIYLNPQSWAVLAEILDKSESTRIMDTVEKWLHCDFGYVQCTPSYTKLDNHIGRATGFVPGSVENGSVYNHGVTFKIAADCMLGRAEEAYRSLREILPDNPVLSECGVEPYAMTNMYLGPDNYYEATFAPCSWITGTAGWMYRCITEFIFGIKAEMEGLRITPCMTNELDRVKISRRFRGVVYHIEISHAKVSNIFCDGQKLEGNLIPIFEAGSVHEVKVYIS